MGENYKGVSWEETYPDEELRDATKTYAHFFREEETKLRNEKRKQGALAKNSLDNIII